jgi:hypothetical protein
MELAVLHGADVNTVSREVFQKYNQRREKKEIEQEATAYTSPAITGKFILSPFCLRPTRMSTSPTAPNTPLSTMPCVFRTLNAKQLRNFLSKVELNILQGTRID